MVSLRANVVSSFTIIKGSMVEETYAVMLDWNFEWSRKVNLRHVKDNNTVGAQSSNWLRDICAVIHRRYEPNTKDRALTMLAKTKPSMEVWKPVQLWHMTRDEFLVRDFFVNWLFKEYDEGTFRIRSDGPFEYLKAMHSKGMVKAEWSGNTTKAVAGALLRMAVVFGLMSGTVVKEFKSYHLPEESFLYLLHAMYEVYGNARKVVHSSDWRLFLMTTADVERELFRLHQFRKLHYEVAGSVVELTLPCNSAAAFIEELAG